MVYECHFMLTLRKDVYIHLLKRTNLVHAETFPHWLEHVHKRTQKQRQMHMDKIENVICHFTLLKSETEYK